MKDFVQIWQKKIGKILMK